MFVGENAIASFNDTGVVTYANNTTAPHPFPLTVREAEILDIVFEPASGNANDRYSIYALIEEWLVL